MDDVVADQLEVGMLTELADIVLGAAKEVVHTDHIVSLAEEVFAKMTAQKPGPAGDENSLHPSLSIARRP
jgi:hypothetical protein